MIDTQTKVTKWKEMFTNKVQGSVQTIDKASPLQDGSTNGMESSV